MKKTLIIAAIALIITAGITSFVSAQEQNKMNKLELTNEMKAEREVHREKMEFQREEMQEIMENGTYEEWKILMENRARMTDYITPENFAKFQEAHKLRQTGDHEGAQEIMKELGIEGNFGIRGKGMHNESRGMKQMSKNCSFQK